MGPLGLAMTALFLIAGACRSSPRATAVDAGPDARVDTTRATVDVRLLAPGWHGEEMERQGLVPAEAALRRAPGVASIEGFAVTGAALLRLTFDRAVTLDAARQSVRDLSPSSWPDGITVEVSAYRGDLRPLRFVVRSDTRSIADVRDVAERIVVPRLARTPGVVDVHVWGGSQREAAVRVDIDRLAAFGLRLREVTAALARTVPYAIDDVRAAVVGTRNGAVVHVADVALVELGVAPPDCWVAGVDGSPRMEGTASVAEASVSSAGAALDAARTELPPDATIERVPEGTVRATARVPAGERLAETVSRIAGALRDVTPAASARIDRPAALPTLPGEVILDLPPGSVAAAEAALGAGPLRTPDDELRLVLVGADHERLAAAAEAVRASLAALPNAPAVGLAATATEPRLDVKPDAEALARSGIAAADLDEVVRAATTGVAVARVRDGDRDMPLVVYVPRVDMRDPSTLARIGIVPSGGGAAVPIDRLAMFVLREGPAELLRRDGERAAIVWVRGGPARRDAVLRAARAVPLPAGVRIVEP